MFGINVSWINPSPHGCKDFIRLWPGDAVNDDIHSAAFSGHRSEMHAALADGVFHLLANWSKDLLLDLWAGGGDAKDSERCGKYEEGISHNDLC